MLSRRSAVVLLTIWDVGTDCQARDHGIGSLQEPKIRRKVARGIELELNEFVGCIREQMDMDLVHALFWASNRTMSFKTASG